MEVHNSIDDAECAASHHWTTLIFDPVKQPHNVASVYRFDWPCAECWVNQPG
jgi:hypothetical protein